VRHKAIYATYSNVSSINGDGKAFDSSGNKISLDESLVSAKIAELEAADD